MEWPVIELIEFVFFGATGFLCIIYILPLFLNYLKRRWQKLLSQGKDPLFGFLCILVGAMVGCLITVGLEEFGSDDLAWFLGTDDQKNGITYNKTETIKLIALGIGGIVAAIVAVAFNRRAKAQEENNRLTKKSRIDERFNSAVQNLGSPKQNVRIAAFYQFYYLARIKDPDGDNFRESIFDILCSHLRSTTLKKSYQEQKGKDAPTEECQTLLNILFKPIDKSVGPIFYDFKAELQEIYLRGANLQYASFVNANLGKADLIDTNLKGADFSRASLIEADLRQTNSVIRNSGAHFKDTIFYRTLFISAKVQKLNFKQVSNIDRADFRKAKIQGVQFPEGKGIYERD